MLNKIEICQIKMSTFRKYFSNNYLIIILVKFCTIIKIGAKKTNVEYFIHQSRFLSASKYAWGVQNDNQRMLRGSALLYPD